MVGLTWPQLTAARNVDQAKLPGYLLTERPVQAKTPSETGS